MADSLSKGNMEEVAMEMPEGKDVSGRARKVLLGWMRNPVVDRAADLHCYLLHEPGEVGRRLKELRLGLVESDMVISFR